MGEGVGLFQESAVPEPMDALRSAQQLILQPSHLAWLTDHDRLTGWAGSWGKLEDYIMAGNIPNRCSSYGACSCLKRVYRSKWCLEGVIARSSCVPYILTMTVGIPKLYDQCIGFGQFFKIQQHRDKTHHAPARRTASYVGCFKQRERES